MIHSINRNGVLSHLRIPRSLMVLIRLLPVKVLIRIQGPCQGLRAKLCFEAFSDRRCNNKLAVLKPLKCFHSESNVVVVMALL